MARDRLLEWYGFDLFEGFTADDQAFLRKMRCRRHCFTHNSGYVDQEYLDTAGDTSVKLNERLRFRSREVRRLLPLVRRCGENVVAAFSAIRPPSPSSR